MVKSGLDIPGPQVDRVVEHGTDSLVVEGTGLGNVAAPLAESMKDPVSSRCLEETTERRFGRCPRRVMPFGRQWRRTVGPWAPPNG